MSEWKERARPARLERRYEFPDYETLREFLDRVAELSEQEGLYPDMGFGRTYLNVTIHADEDAAQLGERQRRFAERMDALLPAAARPM
ncbi:putative pterin-4 alpha-carbinolamine dehydratase-like protein [Thioalkalivibrio nitratireducens DSM 14787]|uniref:4a-hydroxytetrahydrobiopterin dehydratase n=1 Tax=Thioalkalivibrio nitratireducens (strain DSM 14787 / UNIQEM 213 / ALEN2) TaxID=1255043 RepID=L0DZZ0_THIND|nr:4a-hydroxytetrahydrobiopterin dehydratase [Thioalkalivibrio nitratireducens]AGA34618.1 putative pterin-4 alpha-carbinolamine dehydratase-like protein [Thioalkalivibrio nitratireducens DSM 14787]